MYEQWVMRVRAEFERTLYAAGFIPEAVVDYVSILSDTLDTAYQYGKNENAEED